jgi:transposase
VSSAYHGLLDFDFWNKPSQYMEDNAPIHGTTESGSLLLYKRQLGIPTMWWPPSSPDFNPIEQIWRILKQRIKHRQHPPRTREELIQAIQEEWDRLKPKDWQKYIDNMEDRMKEAKKRHGLQTRY